MGPQQESCLSEDNMEIKQYLHNAAHAFFLVKFSCSSCLEIIYKEYLSICPLLYSE